MKKNMNGDQALQHLINYDFKTVLDLGSGKGNHARILRFHGRQVTTIGLCDPADWVGDYMLFDAKPFDAIWCCHALEHQININMFLSKIFTDLKDDGILAITVPPSKSVLVGGHISLWSAGTLVYNLVLAGFDCSAARVGRYGYNVSVIVRKKAARLPKLTMANGDLEKLDPFFPVKTHQRMDADFSCNWRDR